MEELRVSELASEWRSPPPPAAAAAPGSSMAVVEQEREKKVGNWNGNCRVNEKYREWCSADRLYERLGFSEKNIERRIKVGWYEWFERAIREEEQVGPEIERVALKKGGDTGEGSCVVFMLNT